MRPHRVKSNYIIGLLSLAVCTLFMVKTAQAGPRPGGFTERELKSRGGIQGQEFRRRSKLRQLRIQESRMPQDVRTMVTMSLEDPGDARPEIMNKLARDHTRFIAGGWMWNSGAVPLYAGITGPTKGFTDPYGGLAEYAGSDPEGIEIAKETPVTEWWEFSARERRAEFFRARFGAAQQMQSMPGGAETGFGEAGETGQTGFSPSPESMSPGGIGDPGGF